MIDRKLIASVALFRELYDKNRDIYDVIAALLKAAIVFERKWAFNTTDASHLLESTFGFQIPEAAVKTTLRNRLKTAQGIVTFENGIYSVVSEKIPDTHLLEEELTSTRNKQNRIMDDLITYIEKHSKHPVDNHERQAIQDSFAAFLLDNDIPRRHSSFISSFIIEKQSEERFQELLNAVREGFVLYDGIRYSSDLNNLGLGGSGLTIYLDTEHLFNAAGFNGELYRQLFDDFYKLVREANKARKKSITLKYFAESSEEIERFFHVAERILRGEAALNPSKAAMLAIVTGSKTSSDILQKKSYLFAELKRRRITLEDRTDFYDESEYVVEGASLIGDLKQEAKDSQRSFDRDACIDTLEMFTKINRLRCGSNNGPFESIGYILLSGKSYTHYLAFHPLIRQGPNMVPFATDLDFVTNRLWFILEKGLSKDVLPPRSMNVVAKAQVVLSSQINNSVSEQYEKMNKRIADGSMTIEEAQYLNHELRSKAAKPEEITADSLDDRMQFLVHGDFETYLREKSRLEQAAKDGQAAKEELAAIKEQQSDRKRKRIVRIAKAKISLLIIGLLALVASSLVLFVVLVGKLRTADDSPLTILGLVFSSLALLLPFIKRKKIWGWLGKKYRVWSSE